jgi:hypothetical protein
MTLSAASDDTSLPELPPVSALGRDVERKLAELSAGTTSARIARTNARAEKLAAKRKQKKAAVDLVANATKQLAKLTRDQELDEQAKIVDRIALRGLQVAEGLFLKADEEGYNADATAAMADASTRTHFGMSVYKQMMANRRENMATARALGVVVLKGRMEESEWNTEAHRVDEEQRRAHAIDVAAEMVAEDGD